MARRPLDSDGNPPIPGQMDIEQVLSDLTEDERAILNDYASNVEPKLKQGQELSQDDQRCLAFYQSDVAPKLVTKRPMTAAQVVAARLKGPNR